MLKAGKAAIRFLEKCLEKAHENGKNKLLWDQAVFNDLIKQGTINTVRLPSDKFMIGVTYFQNAFATRINRSPVMVHNQNCVGLDNKIYRFKEHLLWSVDTDGYYSSSTNKYFMYATPDSYSRDDELSALMIALEIGEILDRIIILPEFTCPVPSKSKCNLRGAHGLSVLEPRFHGKYREHVFLRNPKTPPSVVSSISPAIKIDVGVRKKVKPSRTELRDMLNTIKHDKNIIKEFKVLRFILQ
jgi:hypothetical protein